MPGVLTAFENSKDTRFLYGFRLGVIDGYALPRLQPYFRFRQLDVVRDFDGTNAGIMDRPEAIIVFSIHIIASPIVLFPTS